MKFHPTQFDEAWLIEPKRHEDERGYFARTWCQQEFVNHGLNPCLVQMNISYNRSAGTLRGLHFQAPPHEETKLVRCVRGSVYDVIADLRTDSPTYLRWQGFELDDRNQMAVYVPEGFAHGFLTLSDNTELLYQMSEFYHDESACGIRWDDPSLAIDWRDSIRTMSDRDASLPYIDRFERSATA